MHFSRNLKFSLLAVTVCLSAWNFSLMDFFQFSLKDLDNKPVGLEEYRNNSATAVIFLLCDCPASESYTLTLNKLAKKYEKSGVKFMGVFPGRYSTDAELKTFQKTYKVSFPLLKDPDMSLAKYLKATIAPQCFVIDSKSQIAYKGRIDDWLFAVGKSGQRLPRIISMMH